MSFPTWLHRLGEHSVLLLVVMPLLGAGLVLCAARSGADVVRRIALINSGLSVAIALLMLACGCGAMRSDGAGASRLVVRIPWVQLTGEDDSTRSASGESSSGAVGHEVRGIEFAVGIDGLGLWPAALTALAVWGLLIGQPRRGSAEFVADLGRLQPVAELVRVQPFRDESEFSRLRLRQSAESGRDAAGATALLLLCQAALIGVFAARDVVLLCVCLACAAILAPLSAGLHGGEGRRAPARRLMFQQLAGAGAFTLGLAGCAAAQTIMGGIASHSLGPAVWDLDALIGTIREVSAANPLAGVVWRQLSPWVFLAAAGRLCADHGRVSDAGLACRGPCAPGPRARAAASGFDRRGGYLLLRLVIPLCQTVSLQLAPPLLALAVGGMLFAAAWMQRATDSSRAYAGLAQIVAGLIFAGGLTFAPAGLRGAGWLVTAACVFLPLLQIATAAGRGGTATRSSALDASIERGALRHSGGGIQRIALAAAAAALFPGLLLITIAFAELDAWFLGGWLISTLLISGIVLFAAIACARTFGESIVVAGDESGGSWGLALLPLIVAAIWMAVFPHVVLDGIDAALGQIFGGPSSEGG